MYRFIATAFVLGIAPLASVLGAHEGASENVRFEPASLEVAGRGKVEYELSTLSVPENRSVQKSRTIGIGFARFRSSEKSAGPPIFILPGGPGNSILNALKPGNSRLSAMMRDFDRLRKIGDVVIIDQRGFSPRGETLKFAYRTPELPLDQPSSMKKSTEAFIEVAKAAVAESEKKTIDLRGYTVLECADDVRDLAKALKYPQIMLMGGSFGSQWSFAVMRRHPELVARALLLAVEPLDCGYDMPSHVLAAVQRIWFEAEQDPKLKPYLPKGGLWAAARETLQRLERKPVTVTLAGTKDPKTGMPIEIALGKEDFQRDAFLRGPDGPSFVLSAFHEKYDAWAGYNSVVRRSRPAELTLIGPLIDTSLGITPKREYLLRNDPAIAFLGFRNADMYLSTKDIWPTVDVGDEFRTPVVSKIPVLFVNGDWDTQTPIENTLAIAPFFPNSHTVIVERGGHGALNQLSDFSPTTMDTLVGFLKDGKRDGLPSKVTLPLPKFAAPAFEVGKK